MRIEESDILTVRECLRREVQCVVTIEEPGNLDSAAIAIDDYEFTMLLGLYTGHIKCYACQ